MDKHFKSFVVIALVVLIGLVGWPRVADQFLGAEGDTNVTNIVASGYADAASFRVNGTSFGSSTFRLSAFSGACTTATWNPPSVASSGNPAATSATTTKIAFAGSIAGKPCIVGLDSATTTGAALSCYTDVAGSSTISLINLSAAALDFATGTVTVCQVL